MALTFLSCLTGIYSARSIPVRRIPLFIKNPEQQGVSPLVFDLKPQTFSLFDECHLEGFLWATGSIILQEALF
jgi:hypothetical protein